MPGELKQIWNMFAIHAAIALLNKNGIRHLGYLLDK
jgi:hypothetical protein